MSKEAEGDREVLGYKVTMCGKNQMKEFKVYFLNRVELCQEGGMCKKSKQSIGNLEDERWEMYWNNCRGDVYLILEICCLDRRNKRI